MRVGHRRCQAALAVASIFAGTAAIAQPSPTAPVTLEWVAPIGCPSADWVLGEAKTMLGASSGSHKQVAARATVTRTGNEWKVTLITTSDSARGERIFSADSCDALARATALILALTVDPNAKAPIVTSTDSMKWLAPIATRSR